MAGRRRTTLKDVAEDVGVHVSTVSRALNPQTRHFIRPEVAETILQAASRLSYRPHYAAYSLRTSRTLIVGVAIPDIANPVFPPIIQGIEDVLSERGYMAILVNSETRSPRHATVMGALQARGVDGLIVASLERDDPVLRGIVEDGLPVVTVNRRADGIDVPSVTHDDDQGMRLILEHLRRLGHARVINIAGPRSLSTGKARYEAFVAHARALGFDAAPELILHADAFNEKEGEHCTALALERQSGFTAVVASNDRLAIGAIHLLRGRGIACPGDVSVTGFNDMPMVDRFEPPLTTVRVQQHEIGRRAAVALLKLLARNPKEPAAPAEHIVMPVELVVRASTAKPAPRSSQRRLRRSLRA